MRSETDAILSLQRAVAAALPGFTEVLTELEHDIPPRPYALVTVAGDESTSGLLGSPDVVLPVSVYAYVEGSSGKDARLQAERARDALWRAFNTGDIAPTRVPLFDYSGRPATFAVASAFDFTLTLAGQTTGTIAADAQPAEVREALEALAGVGPGQAVPFGKAGGPWQVRFDGALRGVDVGALTSDHATVTSLATGDPAPWRDPRDYLAVSAFTLGTLRDPTGPFLRTVTAGMRLTWRRGGAVASPEMTLTAIRARPVF